jgi:hypothetical protein
MQKIALGRRSCPHRAGAASDAIAGTRYLPAVLAHMDSEHAAG